MPTMYIDQGNYSFNSKGIILGEGVNLGLSWKSSIVFWHKIPVDMLEKALNPIQSQRN